MWRFSDGLEMPMAALGLHQPAVSDFLMLLAGKQPEPVRRNEANSRLLVELILKSWQMLPAIDAATMDGPLKNLLREDDHQRLRRCWLSVISFSKAQIAGCRPLIEALNRHGIHYCLLKGAATGYLLYPEPYMRAAWDFDIGVPRSEIATAEALARKAGFRAAEKDPVSKQFRLADPRLRAMVEAQHYELGFQVRRLCPTNLTEETRVAIRDEPWAHQYWLDTDDPEPWCYAVVDMHHALSLDIGIEELIGEACPWIGGKLPVRIPSIRWAAFHLIFKIYWEGVHNYGKGLYQYADMTRLMPRLDKAVFPRLVQLLEQHNMVAAGHYVLRRMSCLGIELPEHIASFVVDSARGPSGAEPTRLNDVGDMWPKLWDVR